MEEISEIRTGSRDLDEKVHQWLMWDKNQTTWDAIRTMAINKEIKQLKLILNTRLTFGTAGLRGKIGPGYNAINELVIIQTGQGIVRYLEERFLDTLQENGIVVGYDCRHDSRRFAELTATIFLSQGYPVRLFDETVPSVFVPFSVVKYSCVLGVMITASHNSKEDSGYKVFDANGCQFLPVTSAEIDQLIMTTLMPFEESWNTSIIHEHDMNVNPLQEVLEDYMEIIAGSVLPEHRDINAKSNIKIVYTPLHGVGYKYFQKAMDLVGFNKKYVVVDQQKDPNPDFPTIPVPSPEEDVLELALAKADEVKATLILVNDPGADRMSCAEKNIETGEWKVFSGNELGAVMGWWAFECYTKNPQNVPLENVYMISTNLSSKILQTIAKFEGFNYIETLSGFKWIGNKINELQMEGDKKTIFAFEESFGFLCNDTICDKDGIQAAVQLATMTAYLKTMKLTINDQLELIYEKYGYHLTLSSFYLYGENNNVDKIFERLRQYYEKKQDCKCKPVAYGENATPCCCSPYISTKPPQFPKSIANGKYEIRHVIDTTLGFDDDEPDRKSLLPAEPDYQMITFEFVNGLVAILRSNDAQKKLKYCAEVVTEPGDFSDREDIEELLVEIHHRIIHEFIEPKKNGLKLPPKQILPTNK